MKKIYSFYSEKYGEVEGMFDEKGKLLDCWSCRDANWRNEYFNGFMEKLGVQVLALPKKYEKKALEQIRECFGFRECFDDDSDE